MMVPVVVLVGSGAIQSQRDAAEVVFDGLHHYLGVGMGEHLGYLFTGSWTILTGVLILEFVGPNESEGWSVAERVTPIAYLAWSVWLVAFGVVLLLT
jgi:hypothetical protein